MKRLIPILLLLGISINSYAEPTDSCFVYKMVQWTVSIKGGVLVERVGNEQNTKTISNTNGKDLKFLNVVSALNYLSMDGWELVDLQYEQKVTLEERAGGNQIFLLRKKMPRAEAKQYSTPLNPD